MGVMTFDQVRIATIYRSNEVANGLLHQWINLTCEPVGVGHQGERYAIQRANRLFIAPKVPWR